jgi:hypothetical protein
MTTLSQLIANRQNALLSTGPRTDAGKANSSRNYLTLGLYTKTDYVKPEDRDLYTSFCSTMRAELNPACLLEESLVSEITAASWRLRHCDAADAGLTDFDDATDKLRRSIERARSRSTSVLHRGINQLRRLQSGHGAKAASVQVPQLASNCPTLPDLDLLTKPDPGFLADLDAILAEHSAQTELASNCKTDDEFRADLDAFLAEFSGLTAPAASAQAPELASNCKPAPVAAPESASNCKPAPVGLPRTPQIPRSAPCRESVGPYPPESDARDTGPGQCCGKNAPPVLNKAA